MNVRHPLIQAAIAATLLLGALPSLADSLRIGFQKYGTLTVLKARGTLEPRLHALGVDVRWTEFPAGPQMLEGLNVGSIDLGMVGESPPIFAQAAGADLVYAGNEPSAPAGEAIIVAKDSPIKTLAQLKGKKVALNKGSNVHYLLLRALEKAGIGYGDIQPVFLTPADARAAFERGAVDAWVIWDPFFAAAQKQLGARVIVDGRELVSNHQFLMATRTFAQKRPDVLKIVIDELDRTDQWARANPQATVDILSPQLGLAPEIVALAESRAGIGLAPVSDVVITEQQKIADAFSQLNLIPKPINVAQLRWKP